MKDAFDVLIIGAGAVGSAVARELARFQLRIGVLEKELDVCCETSGRNSGVLHAGFNNRPGSLMARFCVEGNRLFNRISQELAIPFQRTGKLVVGFDTEDKKRLEALKETGDINQVPGLEIVDKDRIAQLAPGIGGEWALWSPSTGIFDPFQLTIGLAENAAENGVQFFLGQCVQEVSYEDEVYTVYTDTDEFKGRSRSPRFWVFANIRFIRAEASIIFWIKELGICCRFRFIRFPIPKPAAWAFI